MNYIGDFAEDSTVRIVLTTNNGDGAAVAPSSAFEAADFVIYKNGSTTQKATTNGITISSPFDSVVGLHVLEIDTSNDTGDSGFWTTAADYWVVATPDETIDSQTVVGVIATFSIQNRYSSARLAAIKADTVDIQSRLPATLDSGNMRSSVQSMAPNTLTASALAADAVAEIQSGLATSTGVTAAFTEIKGADWSSGTDTLEEIADASGGGSTVTIAPLSSLSPERVNGTTINVAVGDVSPVSIDVYDANGVAIDLTAQGNLEVCIESRSNIDLQVVAHASITISGTGNRKATWTPNAAAVGTVDKQRWSLRTASGKRVLAYGPWVVERVALNDA
jgi:hypothetical protein